MSDFASMDASAPVPLSPALSAAIAGGGSGAVSAATGPRGIPLILSRRTALGAGAALESWVAAHQAELEALLSHYGAILFRGFVAGEDEASGAPAEAFAAFVRGFRGAAWADLPYRDSLSYAVRTAVCARVCTTNEGRAGGLVWHHEQAQAPLFPRALDFFCAEPALPGCGGGTGLASSVAVHAALAREHPAFLDAAARLGFIYHARLPAADGAGGGSGVGRSWRSFWRCDTQAQAEARMRELGYTWSWEGADGNVLRMATPALPAVVIASGKPVFFNQAIAQALSNAQGVSAVGGGAGASADANAGTSAAAAGMLREFLTFGDGSGVDEAALRFAAEVADAHSCDVEWQRGDIALIDKCVLRAKGCACARRCASVTLPHCAFASRAAIWSCMLVAPGLATAHARCSPVSSWSQTRRCPSLAQSSMRVRRHKLWTNLLTRNSHKHGYF